MRSQRILLSKTTAIIVSTLALMMLSCTQIVPSTSGSQTKVAQTTKPDQHIFVASFPNVLDVGDAMLHHGVLNVKHHCLFVDDDLVIFNNSSIQWTQSPLLIHDRQQTFKIGDRVAVGGSLALTPYSSFEILNALAQLPAACHTMRIWLIHSIDIADYVR